MTGPVLHVGDCISVLAELGERSVDAVVTDPPYGLGFMGHEWDQPGEHGPLNRAPRQVNGGQWNRPGRTGPADRGSVVVGSYDLSRPANARFQRWCEAWAKECLRVLKPGGHMVAFGGTRTFHRLTCGLEDAGFEVRDCLVWLSGTGLPKSLQPYRKMAPCPYIENALHAVRLSPWLPLESDAVRVPTALALVEMQPEGDLAVAIRTGEEDASPALTVTSWSEWTGTTSLNTAKSWPSSSAESWKRTSTSIMSTMIAATTAPRTLKFLTSLPTATNTPRAGFRPDGCECDAATAATLSTVGDTRRRDTQPLIAPELATAPLAPLRGLGTSLKPGWDPIVLARRPLGGTVAANMAEHGTGALNIDGCRVPGTPWAPVAPNVGGRSGGIKGTPAAHPGGEPHVGGRWPANVILDEEAAAQLDEQTGEKRSGGASRFFYHAKASAADRGKANTHPTVKPVALMRWLVRLVTSPGGLVLDPFAGSGTTGVACVREGVRFVGVERDEGYAAVARRRLHDEPATLFGGAA